MEILLHLRRSHGQDARVTLEAPLRRSLRRRGGRLALRLERGDLVGLKHVALDELLQVLRRVARLLVETRVSIARSRRGRRSPSPYPSTNGKSPLLSIVGTELPAVNDFVPPGSFELATVMEDHAAAVPSGRSKRARSEPGGSSSRCLRLVFAGCTVTTSVLPSSPPQPTRPLTCTS